VPHVSKITQAQLGPSGVRVWLSQLDAGKGKQRASFVGALTEVVGTPDSVDATGEPACEAVGVAPEDVFVARHDPKAHRWELLIFSSPAAPQPQAAEMGGAAEDGAEEETPAAGPGSAPTGPKQLAKMKKKSSGKGKGGKARGAGGPAAGRPFKLSEGDLLAVIPRSSLAGPAPAPGAELEGLRNAIEALFDTEHDVRMRAETAASASKRAARAPRADRQGRRGRRCAAGGAQAGRGPRRARPLERQGSSSRGRPLSR
jgi:hypothetical protein